jgi:hypothetical protein
MAKKSKKSKQGKKPRIVLWRLRHDLRTNVIATHCSPQVDSFCWLYQGGVPLGNGYLAVNWPGKNGLEHAHVAAYKLFKGKIPRGKRVVHKCETQHCVRYDHLKLTSWEK